MGSLDGGHEHGESLRVHIDERTVAISSTEEEMSSAIDRKIIIGEGRPIFLSSNFSVSSVLPTRLEQANAPYRHAGITGQQKS